MKRALAVMLAAAVASSGCAIRVPVGSRSPVARATRITRAATPAQSPAGTDRAAWERYLANLPIGARVKVETADGKSFKGVFMGVESGQVTVKPRTRIPEPPRAVPIASLISLELDQGSSTARTVAIAAGVAAATVLGIFVALTVAIND